MFTLKSQLVLALVAAAASIQARVAAQPAAMDLDAVTKTITVRGLSFPVVDLGTGPAVLLLHGFPTIGTYGGIRSDRSSRPGFGLSRQTFAASAMRHDHRIRKDAGLSIIIDDVLGILDALQVREAQLVAHDWGAAVGWRLAAEHPVGITRYAALSVGAPGGPMPIEQREKSWYIAFFRQSGIAEKQLMANDWQLFREWARNTRDTNRYIERLSRPGALTAGLNWYRASGDVPTAAGGAASPISIPVLGVWSDGDAYLTEVRMKTSGDRIRGPFTYRKVSRASHWLMLDQPQELNRLLLDFLQR